MTIEDDEEREKQLDRHSKVGKSFKRQVQDMEKEIDQVERELVEMALKLPNKTHVDSPVGGEEKNVEVTKGGPPIKQGGPSHL